MKLKKLCMLLEGLHVHPIEGSSTLMYYQQKLMSGKNCQVTSDVPLLLRRCDLYLQCTYVHPTLLYSCAHADLCIIVCCFELHDCIIQLFQVEILEDRVKEKGKYTVILHC